MLRSIIAFLLFSCSFLTYAQTSFVWNGSSSDSFHDAANWIPSGIPSSADDAYINLNNGNLEISQTVNVKKLDILNGTANITSNLNISGNFNCRNVNISGNAFTVNAGAINFGGTNQNVEITQSCTFTSASFKAAYSRFYNTVSITKTGDDNDFLAGGNRFESNLNVALLGTGNFTFGGSIEDFFGGKVDVEVRNNATIQFAFKGNPTVFREPITIKHLQGGFKMGQSGGVAVLKNNASITFQENAYVSGDFWIKNLLQENTGNFSFAPLGEGKIQIEEGCRLNGDVTVIAPTIKISESVFFGKVNLTKTGKSNDVCKGGNTFNSDLQITVQDSGFLLFGNEFADEFLGSVEANSNGVGTIFLAHKSQGNIFKKSIEVASAKKGGVRFGFAGGSARFIDNAQLQIGSQGFEAGNLSLKQVDVQTTFPWNISVSDSAILQIENGCKFANALQLSGPNVRIDSSKFFASLDVLKTGKTNDAWKGGSEFSSNLNLEVTNTGSIFLGNNFPDQFLGAVTVKIDSAASVNFAHKSSGNTFNEPLTFDFLTKGNVRIGQDGGHAIFRNNFQLIPVANGLNAGSVLLDSCVFENASNFEILAPFTENLVELNHCTFNQPVKITTGKVKISNSVFPQRLEVTKTGSGFDTWKGGNLFAQLHIENSGTGTLVMGDAQPDDFSGACSFLNSGTGNIYLWHKSEANEINNDLSLRAIQGKIYSGLGNGNALLINASQLNVISEVGDLGTIDIKALRQVSSNTQIANVAEGETIIQFDSCQFASGFSIRAKNIFLDKCTFEAPVFIEKTGTKNNVSGGGNTFNSTVAIHNLDSAVFGMGNGLPDVFADSLTIKNTGVGTISMAYNSYGNEINGVLSLAATSGTIRFGIDTGSVSISNQIVTNETLFDNANLVLGRCTLLGANERLLELGENAIVTVGPEFNAVPNVTLKAGSINLEGSKFQSQTHFIKTGAKTDVGRRENIFEDDVFVEVPGTGIFQFSYKDSGDVFLGDIYANAINGTIKFGTNGGKTNILPGKGVYSFPTSRFSGKLHLANVTFSSNSNLNIVCDTNSQITLGPESVFKEDVRLAAGSIGIISSEFEGISYFENFGDAYLISSGKSVFKDSVHFNHTGTSGWGFNENTYLKPVVFTVFNDNNANLFCGEVHNNSTVYFNDVSTNRLNLYCEKLVFNGNASVAYNVNDSIQPIKRLELNLDPGSSPARIFGKFSVDNEIKLENGILRYYNIPITLGASATVLGGNNNSYLERGVIKQGGLNFTLPLGVDGTYRPIGFFKNISDLSKIEVTYIASAFENDFASVPVPSKFESISDCGYWFVSNLSEKILSPIVHVPKDDACYTQEPDKITPIVFSGGDLLALPNSIKEVNPSFYVAESDSSVRQNFIVLYGASENKRPFAFPLIDFEVYKNGAEAVIQFTTVFEKDNKLFELQRAINSSPFEAIDTLPPGANPNQIQEHIFTDSLLIEGIYHYRVRQESIYGISTYTDVKSLNLNNQKDYLFYPSPFTSAGATVEIVNNVEGTFTGVLFNVTGQAVASFQIEKLDFPIKTEVFKNNIFKDGIYNLRITGPNDEQVIKVVRANN